MKIAECPVCHGRLEAVDVICPNCGSKIRTTAERYQGLDSSVRELRTIIDGALAYAISEIMTGRKKGVIQKKAEELVEEAKKALREEDFSSALAFASSGAREAEMTNKQFNAVTNAIERSMKKISLANEYGRDVSSPQELLERALEAVKEGDYKKSLRLALKSGAMADKSKSQYDAWKVEISDYL